MSPASEALQDLKYEIEDWIERVEQTLRDLEAADPEAEGAVAQAEAYWLGHIKGAVDKGAYGILGGSMVDMAETISELEELGREVA